MALGQKLRQSVYEFRTAPIWSYNSDLYIVEYPKSGITWFSTILARLYWIRDDRNKVPTHFSLEQIIGDVHKNKIIQVPQTYPYHRTIKSHARYNSRYRNVVYLIRNPFSVMQSYYHFTTSRNEFSGSIEQFIEHPGLGIDAWVKHVRSWIYPLREPNFQVVKYEDISNNSIETLAKLFASLGFNFSDEEIDQALSYSSFDNMRADNDLYKELNPARSYNFVREGKVKAEFSSDIHNKILERSKDLVDIFYPEYRFSK